MLSGMGDMGLMASLMLEVGRRTIRGIVKLR
jgi:hypothetical protein